MATTLDTLVFMETLRSGGLEEREARAITQALTHATSQELATKSDLATLRNDIETLRLATKSDLAALRSDIDALRLSTKSDIEALRLATKGDLAALKADLEKGMAESKGDLRKEIGEVRADILKWGVLALLGQAGLITTLVKLL